MDSLSTKRFDDLAAAGPGETRNRRSRIMVPIAATETIRNRLQMTEGAFSEALGYAAGGTYSEFKRTGKIIKTAALAAEALMRRQSANGTATDHILLVCIVKGAPLIYDVTDTVKELTIDGKSFYMVPK